MIFNIALKEVEQARARAEGELARRKAELYEQKPRLKEIDDELANIGLALAKHVLQRPNATLLDIQVGSKALLAEREELMAGVALEDNLYTCATCKDTGFVNNIQCRCLKQRIIAQCYKMSSLEHTLQTEHFGNFTLDYYPGDIDQKAGISPRQNMERILDISKKFVKNFDDAFDNLLFCGHTGLGKTFLSHCIAKELLDNGKTVLYTTSPQLFSVMEDYRFRREASESSPYIEMTLNADLLVLDDLGAELSNRVTSADLFNIVNSRLISQKSTIISTNLQPSDLETLYNDRITSRIQGQYRVLRFIGEDIRLAKKYSKR